MATPERGGTLTLMPLCLLQKYLVFGRDALGLCFERCIGVDHWTLAEDHGNAPVRMNQGGCPGTTFASFPCQDLHLKWALCSARLGSCHVRGRMEDCACPVRPGESLQLSQSLILLTLWVPSLPSLWEEGAWRVGASLLHLWPLSKRLFSLHQTQFHYWQSKPGWRKNPLW